jgi:hypothetical protein
MRLDLAAIVAVPWLALFVSASSHVRADDATAATPMDPVLASKDPRASPRKPRAGGWLALPVVGYAPETSMVLGGVVMRYLRIDDESHDTTVAVLATASLRKQFIVELLPELYFARNDYRIGAHLLAQHFPDRFFGVGNGADDSTTETYGRRSFELRSNFRRRVAGEFYVGLTGDQLFADIEVTDPGGLLATRQYTGEQGGVSSSVGVAASFDERDERAYPTRGAFVELSLAPFLRALGSQYQFFRTTLDARYFVSTWSGHVCAVRYLLDLAFGEVPFYQLPQFGGPNSMRGYYRGKFRDMTVHTLEIEYRLHLFWLLGAAVFAGAGQVGEDVRAAVSAPLRASAGGGLRLDVSGGDRYNLRVDAAGSPGEFGLYVSLLEAF